jgi:DNA mismatch endonuclease (patch repair protein)
MTDFLSKETRGRVMSRIRSRDTTPELRLRRALHAAGARGWRCHARQIAGKPDLAFTRWKVAVFVDGCFWHCCPEHGNAPRANVAYWQWKLAKNRARDAAVDQALRRGGWNVVRLWEHVPADEAAEAVAVALGAQVSRRRRD